MIQPCSLRPGCWNMYFAVLQIRLHLPLLCIVGVSCNGFLNRVPPRPIASFSPSPPTAADQYVTKLYQESARPPAKQPPNEPDLEEATIPMEYPMQDLGNKKLYRLQKLPPRAWQRLDLPAGAAKLCQRAPPQAMVPLSSRSSCCEA